MSFFLPFFLYEKSPLHETLNLSTDADSSTETCFPAAFARHFWGPFLTATLGVHFWPPLLGSFFDRHFWGPLLAATFGVLF